MRSVESEGDRSTRRLLRLRRLIVCGNRFERRSRLYKTATIIHLSLDTLPVRLPPLHTWPAQLETLALSDRSSAHSWTEYFPSLPLLKTLRHLSLALVRHPSTAHHLFIAARGLKLKTLHLTTSFISKAKPALSLPGRVENVGEELAKAVRGKSDYLEVERVIIYGRSGSDGLGLDEETIRMLDWRIDVDRPPFEDFDGSG